MGLLEKQCCFHSFPQEEILAVIGEACEKMTF